MKKTLLVITAALLLCVSAFAQWENRGQGFQRPDEATLIKMRTDWMVRELGLNETQAEKLLELNQKYPNALRPGQGGPGMGRARRERPEEANVGQEGNETEKATGKEARKARKAKKDKEAEGQVDEMQAAREAYENELKEILTEDQFKTWKENMNRRQQGQGRPGGYGPGGGVASVAPAVPADQAGADSADRIEAASAEETPAEEENGINRSLMGLR